MKKPSTALYATQILATTAVAAAAYLLTPRRFERNQVAIITGGSRGLGLALAERFGRAGCRLVLGARSAAELARAQLLLLERGAVAHAGDILTVPGDLTDPAAAEALIDAARDQFGEIDILINNAGIIEVGPVEDQSLAAYHRAMNTNFYAALYTTYAALPHLLHRRKSEGDAAVVNIASIGGKFAMPHLLPYVASKFALVGFSEGLHSELRHKGVRVTTVCPGLMRTGSHLQAQFAGDQEKEYNWFSMSATMPGIATSTTHAAERIFQAVVRKRAEITITPQAWLAARFTGVAPGAMQYMAAIANEYFLPSATGNQQTARGFQLDSKNPEEMREAHNQHPEPPES